PTGCSATSSGESSSNPCEAEDICDSFSELRSSVRLSSELAIRTERLLHEFDSSAVSSAFFRSFTDPNAIQIAVRRLLFEVATYGPWITSATFTAIGRLSQIWPDVTLFAEHLLEEV